MHWCTACWSNVLLFLHVNSIALFVMLWYFGMLFSRGGWLWLTSPNAFNDLVLLKHALMMRVTDWRILELQFAPGYWYIISLGRYVCVCEWVNGSMSVQFMLVICALQNFKRVVHLQCMTQTPARCICHSPLKGDLIYLCCITLSCHLTFDINSE